MKDSSGLGRAVSTTRRHPGGVSLPARIGSVPREGVDHVRKDADAMSLISRFLETVRSWRQRRVGPKTSRRAGVSMEHLDHRQLLSVNFTGIVATDFPASTKPGVVILPNGPGVEHPSIPVGIQPIVKVSGFDINGLRVSYSKADDTLNIGIEQPASNPADPASLPVIAGDADNNGNDGTVNPAITALPLYAGFKDFANFGGDEYMAVSLDLANTGVPDIVAGYKINDPRSPKEYQVAKAISNPSPTPPDFGQELPQFEGNVYKNNSAKHPALEFAISNFSQLYLQETGKALNLDANPVIKLGAFAGSGSDLIGEANYPPVAVNLKQATLLTTVCPPASPPIIINPHSNRHINTAHPDLIRVNVLGSSGFDVSKIDPTSVTLGGAHPVFAFDRFINKDEWPDATFVFKGTDVTLPAGFTEANVSGNLTDGTTFSSSVKVFNRDRSYYSPAQNQAQMQREADRETRANGFLVLPPGSPIAAASVGNGATMLDMGTTSTSSKAVSIPGVTPNANSLNVSYTPPPVAPSSKQHERTCYLDSDARCECKRSHQDSSDLLEGPGEHEPIRKIRGSGESQHRAGRGSRLRLIAPSECY